MRLYKLRNLFKLVVILLLFFGCEHETETKYKHDLDTTIGKKISFSQFKNELGSQYCNKTINPHNLIINKYKKEQLDFITDTTKVVKHISKKNTVTYSIRIYPLNKEQVNSSKIYNLVFYKLDKQWKNDIFSFIKTRIGERIQYTNIEKLNSISATSSRTCYGETYNFNCTKTGSCAKGTCDLCYECVTTVIAIGDCLNQQIDPNDGGGGAGEYEFNPNNDGFGGNTNLTTEQLFELFYEGLTDEQTNWLDQNQESKSNIANYLNQNNYSTESKNFSEQLINEIINTPPTEINVNTSLKTNNQTIEITNINEFLKCFNPNQGGVFTIYVDQPIPNSNSPYKINYLQNDLDVGHTFISILQNGIRRVIGFYPKGNVNLQTTSTTGLHANNSEHEFDTSFQLQ